MNETKWLTVKQASQHCFKMNLPRSTKSLRRWCAKEEIEAQKRKVANTEKWFIDRESLEIKIKEELEFLKHADQPLTQFEHITAYSPDTPGHEWTQPDTGAQERLQADVGGHERSQQDKQFDQLIRDRDDQILLLKNDIKWRDQVLKDQKSANEKLLDEVKGQSRYIGHLETNVLRLGGNMDQAFLAAPVPNSARSEPTLNETQLPKPEIIHDHRPHPNHGDPYTG